VNQPERMPVRAAFGVVRGFTYSERSQVINSRLVPSYQMLYRWMGSEHDAEEATRWLFETVVTPLELPAPVEDVNGRLARASLRALGQHWSAGYGVSPTRWAAIVGCRNLVSLQNRVGLESLFDPLPGELRLVVALRFLRQRQLSAIANKLRLPLAAANLLLFEALTAIGVRLGLPEANPTLNQAGLVARFVEDLTARRRPFRFECGPGALTALLAAAHVQSAIAGNDLPSPRFVRRLSESCNAAT
jgi:hypothetical protein